MTRSSPYQPLGRWNANASELPGLPLFQDPLLAADGLRTPKILKRLRLIPTVSTWDVTSHQRAKLQSSSSWANLKNIVTTSQDNQKVQSFTKFLPNTSRLLSRKEQRTVRDFLNLLSSLEVICAAGSFSRFLRTKCKACNFERAVPFSCKGRGFCPSCCGKKMAEKAYHLIDNVLPNPSYRQWVLSLPIPLRFWMATNKNLTSKVHQITSEEIAAYYASGAKSKGIKNPLPGSITFIQRFGSACNLNTHFHLVALEGVYVETHTEAIPRFVASQPPTDQEVSDVVEKIATKTIQVLAQKGISARRGRGSGADRKTVKNHRWAKLLASTFKVDVGTCPKCGEDMEIIGAVQDPTSVQH